jgi:hypothetical protein
MTLISPVPRWWAWWLRFIWKVTRLALRVSPRAYPFGRLQKLSFIHFAHWSLFDRVPTNSASARKLPHPYLVFQSNFNRGWREYVEGFCLVVPWGLRANWRGAYGFPDPDPVGPFLDYVEPRFTPCLHYYSAYPDDSTRMVISAVDGRERFGLFASEETGPAPRLMRRKVRRVTPLGGHPEPTDTLSVLTPVSDGRVGSLRAALEGLPKEWRSPLARVPGTHMARWSLVKPLPFKKTNRTIDSTWYLLFTSWFDGTTSAYVHTLRTTLPREADAIWGNCVGYPTSADPLGFWNYLMDHMIVPRLQFAGYPQRMVDVRAALELKDMLTEPVAEAARQDSAELERGWRKRHRAHAA